ncbi:MAG: glycosyltransferase family 2 protein, partial [Rhodovulum sp.]
RGLPNRAGKAIDLAYWVERNFNSVEDRSIAAMAPATAGALARLRAVPGVAELHAAAVDWHRAAFRRIVTDPEEHALYTRLLLAGGSRALPAAVRQQAIALYHRARIGAGQ